MELETINKLYLELSQITTATTAREILLQKQLAEAQRDSERLDELIERVAELRKALDASEAALKSCGATYSGLDGYGAPSRLVQHHDTVLVEIARAAIDAARGKQ